MKCKICKRKIKTRDNKFEWILGELNLKNLYPLCKECNECLNEQIWRLTRKIIKYPLLYDVSWGCRIGSKYGKEDRIIRKVDIDE